MGPQKPVGGHGKFLSAEMTYFMMMKRHHLFLSSGDNLLDIHRLNFNINLNFRDPQVQKTLNPSLVAKVRDIRKNRLLFKWMKIR